MPGAGARQHDGASMRSPAISTMQARQLPTASQPGLVAKVRDLDAFALGDLDDRFAAAAADLAAVELEADDGVSTRGLMRLIASAPAGST